MSDVDFVAVLRAEFRNAPRFNPQPYVPGFGGHARHTACKCSIADEFVCGRYSSDKGESAQSVMRRRQSALVQSEREARMSAWWSHLSGNESERSMESRSGYQRASRTSSSDDTSDKRGSRSLTDVEWREALMWIAKQELPSALRDNRIDITSQAWIELRCPPNAAEAPASFKEEIKRAWWRAVSRVRRELETAWVVPANEGFDSSGRRRGGA